jgi:poly(3-hydroxybutyrate) depolymerase
VAYRLACDLWDKIAAVAPVSAVMSLPSTVACPARDYNPAVIHFHSRRDPKPYGPVGQPILNPQTHLAGPYSSITGQFCRSVEGSLAQWAARYGSCVSYTQTLTGSTNCFSATGCTRPTGTGKWSLCRNDTATGDESPYGHRRLLGSGTR